MFAETNGPAQMAGRFSIIRFFLWSILIARRWFDSLLASLPYHLMLGPLRISRRFSFFFQISLAGSGLGVTLRTAWDISAALLRKRVLG